MNRLQKSELENLKKSYEELSQRVNRLDRILNRPVLIMVNTKERPIALTAQEVNAVLAGNKTQIRAPVLTDEQVKAGYDWDYGAEGDAAIFYNYAEDGISIEETLLVDCPFGADGDKLWVQEEWRIGAWREIASLVAIDYRASPELTNTPWVQISDDYDDKKFESLWIETTDELDSKGVKPNEDGNYRWPAGQAPLDWQPASTMERWASRLLLEITDIRIEHGDDAWFTNPWVWVIEFKVIKECEQ